MKLETALIISNKFRNPEMTGMPGISGIPYNSDDIKKFKLKTVVKIYSELRRASSYDAVQYGPSLGTLNIVRKDGQKYYIRKYGDELAEIFDEKIRNIEGYDILVSASSRTIIWRLLKRMEEALSLETISNEEIKTFIKIIEQRGSFVSKYSEKSSRVYSTLFILDAFQKHQISEPNDLLTNLWKGVYHPSEELKEISEGWIFVEARRYYQIAIEAILSSFCKYIKPY